MKLHEGTLEEGQSQAKGLRLAAVVSRYYTSLTESMLEKTLGVWRHHGAEEDDLTVVRVPGAFELPGAVNSLLWTARRRQLDAVVTLGIVARGETSHFDWICRSVVEGIARTNQEYRIPVLLGVLTVETLEQAKARLDKAADVAAAAIEMALVYQSMEVPKFSGTVGRVNPMWD